MVATKAAGCTSSLWKIRRSWWLAPAKLLESDETQFLVSAGEVSRCTPRRCGRMDTIK